MALMPATTSTNSSASVEPHPPKGETTFHQDRHACASSEEAMKSHNSPAASQTQAQQHSLLVRQLRLAVQQWRLCVITWARKYRYATRENISQMKMGRKVAMLYLAVLTAFPGSPSSSLPPLRYTTRVAGGPFAFPFPFQGHFHLLFLLSFFFPGSFSSSPLSVCSTTMNISSRSTFGINQKVSHCIGSFYQAIIVPGCGLWPLHASIMSQLRPSQTATLRSSLIALIRIERGDAYRMQHPQGGLDRFSVDTSGCQGHWVCGLAMEVGLVALSKLCCLTDNISCSLQKLMWDVD